MFPFQAVNWVELFLSLGRKCVGYEKAQITPYIHAMVYHVLKFMRLHSGIKKFTGQGKIGTIKSVFTNGQSRKDPYSPPPSHQGNCCCPEAEGNYISLSVLGCPERG